MARFRPRLRPVREAAVCLLLGVVLTVGVAWGIATWPLGPSVELRSAHKADVEWTIPEAGKWPSSCWESVDTRGPGVRVISRSWQMRTEYRRSTGLPMYSLDLYLWSRPIQGASMGISPSKGLIGGVKNPLKRERIWRRLPLRPIWSGFAINTLFYACLSWLVLFAPFAVRRHLRGRRGACGRCGYDLANLDACPECGGGA